MKSSQFIVFNRRKRSGLIEEEDKERSIREKKFEETYKDGKRDGLHTEWYEEGKKKIEENFEDGKKNGLFTFWSPNGHKISEGIYY